MMDEVIFVYYDSDEIRSNWRKVSYMFERV